MMRSRKRRDVRSANGTDALQQCPEARIVAEAVQMRHVLQPQQIAIVARHGFVEDGEGRIGIAGNGAQDGDVRQPWMP